MYTLLSNWFGVLSYNGTVCGQENKLFNGTLELPVKWNWIELVHLNVYRYLELAKINLLLLNVGIYYEIDIVLNNINTCIRLGRFVNVC